MKTSIAAPIAVPATSFLNNSCSDELDQVQRKRKCEETFVVSKQQKIEVFSATMNEAGVGTSRCAHLDKPTVSPDAPVLDPDLKAKAEADPIKNEMLDSITHPFVMNSLSVVGSTSPHLTLFMQHNAAETKGDNATIPSQISVNELLKKCDENEEKLQKCDEFLRTLPQEEQDEIAEVIHLSFAPSFKFIADTQDEIIGEMCQIVEENGLLPEGTYAKFAEKHGSAVPLLSAIRSRFESSGKQFNPSDVFMVFIQMMQKMSLIDRALSKAEMQTRIDETMAQIAEKKLASAAQFIADIVTGCTEILAGVLSFGIAAAQMYGLRSPSTKPQMEMPELPATTSAPSTPASTRTQGGGTTTDITIQNANGRTTYHQNHPPKNTNSGKSNSAKNKPNAPNKTDPTPPVPTDPGANRIQNQLMSDMSRGLSDVIKGAGKVTAAVFSKDARDRDIEADEKKLNAEYASYMESDLSKRYLERIALVVTMIGALVSMETSISDAKRALIGR